MCGGYYKDSSIEKLTRACNSYDQETRVWQPIKSLSNERSSLALIEYDNRLWAIGGKNLSGSLDTVETYNIVTRLWSKQSPLNIARYSFGTAVIDNILYVCDGNNYQPNQNDPILSSCEYYSMETGEWHLGWTMTMARTDFALVAHNDYLYAIGCYFGNFDKGYIQSMERYNTRTKQWQPMANMPTKRNAFGAWSFMDKIYVCGGYDENNSNSYRASSSAMSSCETYDSRANNWTTIASMNTKRYDFQLVAIDNVLYALGGQSTNGTVEQYDYTTNLWSYTTPTLPFNSYGFGATTF
ncbi:kelch-like protein 17 [Oppia nitens]|uniref:kelch-like protein 17 n=1 Tax=Oppia nitens TaxID=1686743 RepID=UPI0023DAE349|nr:kelch-like protein 17 [Oppia nitens]